MGFLFAFGVVNLGLGLACFASGARCIPAAFAALLGTLETVLAPIWVWLIHGEVPSARTDHRRHASSSLALLVHIGLRIPPPATPARPGATGMPSPN